MTEYAAEYYQDRLLTIIPGAFRGGKFDDFWRGFGRVLDVGFAGALDAVRARFPSRAPDDALPYHANERRLEQAPKESLGALRLRLEQAWTVHAQDGTPTAIPQALVPLGLTLAKVYAFNANPASTTSFHWDNDTWWSRTFYVVTAGGHPWARETWSTDGAWDGVGTWGSTATVAELSWLRRVARRFKAAHSYATRFYVVFTGEIWCADGVWASDATWGAATTCEWILGHTWGEEARAGGTDGTWGETAATYDTYAA